jgi:16S rRNA processing protein RimM
MAARRQTSGQVAGKVCVGVITGARGLKGELKVKSFTAEAKDVAAYGPVSDETGGRQFKLSVRGMAKDQVVVSISGITDRNGAEALKGLQLFVPRDALPAAGDEEYYHADLIGMTARDADGESVGTVRGVFDFGAGDMLEIDRERGDTVFVPFTREAVPEVDLAGRTLIVSAPDGLMEPADEAGAEGETP